MLILANCSTCDMFPPQSLWRLSAVIQNLWHLPPRHSRSHRVFDSILWRSSVCWAISWLTLWHLEYVADPGGVRQPLVSDTAAQKHSSEGGSEAERNLGPSHRVNLRVQTSWAVLGCLEMNRADVFNIVNIDMRWMDTGVTCPTTRLKW